MIDTSGRDRTSLNRIETKNTDHQEQNRTAVVKHDLTNQNPVNFSIQNEQEHFTASDFNDGIRDDKSGGIRDGIRGGIRDGKIYEIEDDNSMLQA